MLFVDYIASSSGINIYINGVGVVCCYFLFGKHKMAWCVCGPNQLQNFFFVARLVSLHDYKILRYQTLSQ